MVQFVNLTLLMLLTCWMAVSCAYLDISYDDEKAPGPPVDTMLQGRRFGWAIDWLAARGFIGQIIANVIVAVFILPPLGPFICALFDNCDNLKLQTRAILNPSTPTPVARNDKEIPEEVSRVLRSLDSAHDKYK